MSALALTETQPGILPQGAVYVPGTVYHFTDTARLPWILLDGALKPGRNKIGGFPDPDFLWATTYSSGDRTASASGGGSLRAYRAGTTMQVRFDLDADDFERWPDITTRLPQWTPDQVERLNRAAGDFRSPTSWRCRTDPLPRERWLGIWIRSYRNPTWSPLPIEMLSKRLRLSQDVAAVTITGREYASRQFTTAFGNVGYEVVERVLA